MAEKKKKTQRRTVDKWKKKREFTLFLPALFDKKEMGKTVAEKSEQLMNRTMTLSLRDIMKEARRSPYLLTFKVNNVQGQNVYTETKAFDVQPSFLKRNVRRRSSKIDTIQKVSTSDSIKLKVKTMTITAKKANRSQETAIRKMVEDRIKLEVTKNNYNKFLNNILQGDFMKKVQADAKKVYPIRRFEIVQIKTV